MRRFAPMIAASLFASGCALFGEPASLNTTAQERSRIIPDGSLEQASLVAPQRASARGPVGLAPCARQSFPARNCWRKGDAHVLFPSATPVDMETNSAAEGPLEVSVRKKQRITRLRDLSD